MRRKFSKGKGNKVINKSSNTQKEETKTIEKTTCVIQRTPSKTAQHYLHDEIWDILPKTDYTYARSGSYSPRFFGRKYVNPNMSRYRIRGRGGAAGIDQEDLDYDGYLSSEYSDDDRVGKELQDSDSDISYETVLEDGIELRSGKNLKTMKEILHEHDEKLQQSDLIRSVNRTSYTTSKIDSMSRSRRDAFNENRNAQSKSTNKKALKSKQNQKQYSQSEQKHLRRSDVGTSAQSGSMADYNNVRSRRSLNTDFATHTNMIQNNTSNRRLNGKSTAENYSKSGYDAVDNGRSRQGHSVQTVKKTVTEEFEEVDSGGTEKGTIEAPEKASGSWLHGDRHGHNNIHLYGLDSDGEFSDSDSTMTRRSRYSTSTGSGYGGYSDASSSVSTVTTIVTTVTETISTITRPIIKPVWDAVGEPVWNSVGRPVWKYLCQPVLLAFTSVVYFTWLLLTQPFVYMAKSVGNFCSWLWSSDFEEKLESVLVFPEWLWKKVQYVSWQFVRLDAWLFKRRRSRACCFCLPILLLLPLLIAVFTGVELWSDSKSALVAMFAPEKSTPQIVINEKHEYFHHLNDEVRTMILQLQSNNKDQLTAADVEAIVYRIVGQETAALKANIAGVNSEAQLQQAQWKTEQGIKLEQMQTKHDALLATIQGLETTIAAQKSSMAEKGAEIKAESSQYLAGLEEKLAGLQAELHELEKDYAALLARVNACCHNETYYLAAVKDSVNAILAEMMAGHMSGNPTQDAFTEWLHTHYVSRDVLDKRLEDLASELTTSVVAMIKDLQIAQQEQYHQFEQQQEQSKQHAVHITSNGSGVGEQVYVRQMIDEALFRYSADKIGIADYALESAGGTVVSTRCSESYYRKTALVSVLGIPLWYTSNSPRTVIQPEVYPGQCWAFKGTQGYIVIQTSTIIIPSGFTLEHIPKALAPSGEIDSAPKEFTVFGLESEYDDKGVSLGNYTYNDNGKPMQFFPIQVLGNPKPFYLYELRIISNYGNQEYTCLYRFRIHGNSYRG
ncbi:uncharacterized protein LOC123563667 isoform X2 [Mercenaria mercenaria]|uniref:uncharacterized protein LOC123563667 isoform X2 n=1 Tax=Mercenaria mercenaria TaxID=6596 RepID=UPI00234F501B|nr:uncharacterized protein LOC123563667 isoform X2 [Mercenaria mercenaria]